MRGSSDKRTKDIGMKPLGYARGRELPMSGVPVERNRHGVCKSDPHASLFSSPSDMHGLQYQRAGTAELSPLICVLF